MKQFIVKIQISLFSSEGMAQILVYNKDKTKRHQGDIREDFKNIMKRENKKFFYATIKNKNFVIGEEAPWQDL